MRQITGFMGRQFVCEDGHPDQPEWGRPEEIRQIQEGFDINSLDERDRNRLGLVSPTCIELKAEWTETPYVEPLTEAACIAAIQQRLDAHAQSWGYDSALSAASYAASTVPRFADEAAAIIGWRDATWATGYTVLAEVQAGTRTISTIADLLALLPAPPDRPA